LFFKTSTFFKYLRDISSCPPELKSKADSLRSEADHLLFSLSYKATSRCANSFFIPLHLPLEYPYTSSRFSIMKYLASTIFSLVALIALVPALVAAGDGESKDSDDLFGDPYHPHHPRPTPQVLWGQCGGYYYSGTNVCPEGAYCRYFSDWYSQCNLNGQ